MPSLYLRGKTWWTKVYVNGIPVRESTGMTLEADARLVLESRLGASVPQDVLAAVNTLQSYLLSQRASAKQSAFRAKVNRKYAGRATAMDWRVERALARWKAYQHRVNGKGVC